jgi:WD40 repeat protein
MPLLYTEGLSGRIAIPERRFPPHNGRVNVVAWSHDGQQLATAGKDGIIKIWNPTSGEVRNTLRGHGNSISCLVWLNDNGKLASSAADGTRIWTANQEQRFTPIPGTMRRHAWLPSGRQLITCKRVSDTIRLEQFDLATGTADTIFVVDDVRSAHPRLPVSAAAMALNPTGGLLAVGFDAGEIDIYKLSTKQRSRRIQAHSWNVRNVAWSPNGSMLSSAGLSDGFKVWNPDTGEPIVTLDSDVAGASTAWSPNGAKLATLDGTGHVHLWDVKDWKLIQEMPHQVGGPSLGSSNGLAWNPVGDRLAARLAEWLVVWDANSFRQLLAVRAHLADVRGVTWSPDGRRLATGSEDHTIKIWDAETGEELLTLRGGDEGWITELSWSLDGSILAAGGDMIKLWSAAKALQSER